MVTIDENNEKAYITTEDGQAEDNRPRMDNPANGLFITPGKQKLQALFKLQKKKCSNPNKIAQCFGTRKQNHLMDYENDMKLCVPCYHHAQLSKYDSCETISESSNTSEEDDPNTSGEDE